VEEVGGRREEAFGDVDEDACGLEDFGEVCFDSLAVVEHFVAVARDFEAFSVAVHAYHCHVCEADLVYGEAYPARHVGFWLWDGMEWMDGWVLFDGFTLCLVVGARLLVYRCLFE